MTYKTHVKNSLAFIQPYFSAIYQNMDIKCGKDASITQSFKQGLVNLAELELNWYYHLFGEPNVKLTEWTVNKTC